MLLTRTRPSLYIPFWTALRSIVSATTAGAENYRHLLVIHFFLGIAEAPFVPGAMYLLSCWYRRKALALLIAILYHLLLSGWRSSRFDNCRGLLCSCYRVVDEGGFVLRA